MSELISVIIPVYNVSKYLTRCVESVLNQTYKEMEIILVDDGSTDGSAEICDHFAQLDKRVCVIHKQNGGISDARNCGISGSSGKYINFVDSDDFVDRRIIEELYRNMVDNNTDLSICDIRYCNEKMDNLNGVFHHNNLKNSVMNRTEFWEALLKDENSAYIAPWCKLYKKELFYGLSYPVGKIHEDEYMLKDIIERCHRIGIVGKELYYYIQRKNSIMSTFSIKGDIDKIDALFQRAVYFFESNQNDIAEKTLLLGMRYYSGLERKLHEHKKYAGSLMKNTRQSFKEICRQYFWKRFSLQLKIKSMIWLRNAQLFYHLGQCRKNCEER